MTTSRATMTRVAKVLALLDSDQVGEVRAAGLALQRLLRVDPASLSATVECAPAGHELEACLAYAADAIGALTREIETLRHDNRALRARAARTQTADCWPGSGRMPRGHGRAGHATAH